jgi:hypothetical protein
MKSLLPLVAALLLGAIAWQGFHALRAASVADELEALEAGVADQDLETALSRVLQPLSEGGATDSQRQRLESQRDALILRLAGRDLLVTRPDREGEVPMSLGVARAAPLTGRESISLDFALRDGSPLADEAAALEVAVADMECRPAQPGRAAVFQLGETSRREELRVRAHGSPWLNLGLLGRLTLRADRLPPVLALRIQGTPVSDLADGLRIPFTGSSEIEVSASDESVLSRLSVTWRGEREDVVSAGAGFLDHRFTSGLSLGEEGLLALEARDAAGNQRAIQLTLLRQPKPLPEKVAVTVRGAFAVADRSFVGGNQPLRFELPAREAGADYDYRLQIAGEDMVAANAEGAFLVDLSPFEHGRVVEATIFAVNDERQLAAWRWKGSVDKRGPEIQLEDEQGQPVVVFPEVRVTEGGFHRVCARDAEVGQPTLSFEIEGDQLTAEEKTESDPGRCSHLLRFRSAGPKATTLVARARDALGNEATPRTWTFLIDAPAPEDDAQPPRVLLRAGDAEVEGRRLVFREGEVPVLSITLSDPSGIDAQKLSCSGAEHRIVESRPATHPTFLRVQLTPTSDASGPIAVTTVDLQGRSTKRIWDLTVVDAEAELSGEAIVDDQVVFGPEPRKFRVKLAQPPPAQLLSARLVRQDEEEPPRAIASFEAFNGVIDRELDEATGDWVMEIVLKATDGEKVLKRLAVRR